MPKGQQKTAKTNKPKLSVKEKAEKKAAKKAAKGGPAAPAAAKK